MRWLREMPRREIDNSLNVWEFQVPQFSFTSKPILLTQELEEDDDDSKDGCVLCCVSDFLVVYTRGWTDVDGEVTTLDNHITSQG